MIEKNPELFDYNKLYTALPLAFLPFFLAGYLQAIVFRSAPKKFGKFYGIDLIGATVGSLTIPLLLYPLGLIGTIGVIVLICLIPIGLAIAMGMKQKTVIGAGVAPILVFVILLASGYFRVNYSAGFKESDVIRDYWTPFARVALTKYKNRDMYVIDNSSRTYYVPKTRRDIHRYSNSLYAVPFEMKQGGNAMIIASGGGQEIVMASHFGMERIDAIEIASPIIRDIVNRRKNDPNNPYLLPNVHYYMADGRSVSMRAKHKYDVIQMLEVNCWTQAGQVSQMWSPYFVFTQEAFGEYFEHLKDDGYLCYTIFSRGKNPVAGNKGRRFRSVIAGMKNHGITHPENHIVIMERPYAGYGNRSIVIAKKTPFTKKEIKKMRELLARNTPRGEVYYPDLRPIDEELGIVLPEKATLQKTRKYIHRVRKMCRETTPVEGLFTTMKLIDYNNKPINDDRPYLSGSGLREKSPKNEKFIGDLYKTLLKVMGILVFVFVLLPFAVRRPGGRSEKIRIDPRLLLILACTGVGFMFIEMAGIYKFQLYLHHPTLAMIMVLSSMILGAGLGSLHTGRIADEKKEQSIAIYSGIAIVAALVLLILVPIAGHRVMLALPMPLLLAFTFLIFGGMGFILGHIVPLSIASYAKEQDNLLAWCWAITVTGSVIGTVLASILAREYGMFLVALLGILSYIGVLLISLVGMLVVRLFRGGKSNAVTTESSNK
jgi:spermidine synthase